MLNKAEFFEALQALSPRARAIYHIGLFTGMTAWAIMSAAVIAGLSILFAEWLATADLSTEEKMGAIIMPSVMAFVFVVAGVRGASDPRLSKARNMAHAAWRGMGAGFVVGAVVIGLGHFLSQLLLSRALYGPLEFQSRVSSYCGPIPVIYGLLFALPVAIGTGMFSALASVSAQLAYEGAAALFPLDIVDND